MSFSFSFFHRTIHLRHHRKRFLRFWVEQFSIIVVKGKFLVPLFLWTCFIGFIVFRNFICLVVGCCFPRFFGCNSRRYLLQSLRLLELFVIGYKIFLICRGFRSLGIVQKFLRKWGVIGYFGLIRIRS